jgi:hypothetical protein
MACKLWCIRPLYLHFLWLLWSSTLFAQQEPPLLIGPEKSNEGKAVLFHLGVGAQLPGADLAKRFGPGGQLSGGLEWITRGNFIVGTTGYFSFGQRVKEDPLAMLRTVDGDIISRERLVADVKLRERGYAVAGIVGRLWPLQPGQRAGLRTTFGVGMTRHWIRVQDDSRNVSQLTGDYRKGYDRLVGGLLLHQFIGWQTLGTTRRINWLFGIDLQQGFTGSLRDWDFATQGPISGRRLDLRWGIRAGWTLPFYAQKADKIYY